MSKTKPKPKPNIKQKNKTNISYKFTCAQGGTVCFVGLGDKMLSSAVIDVLCKYGFDCDDGKDNVYHVYHDYLKPDVSMELDETIDTIRDIVPLQVHQFYTNRRVRHTVNISGDEASSNDLFDAFVKAFNKWNKNGRSINDMPLIKALDNALKK